MNVMVHNVEAGVVRGPRIMAPLTPAGLQACVRDFPDADTLHGGSSHMQLRLVVDSLLRISDYQRRRFASESRRSHAQNARLRMQLAVSTMRQQARGKGAN